MEFSPDPPGTPLDLSGEEGTPDSKLRTAFKQTKQQQKWLFSHLTFGDKLDALYSDFTSREARKGNDGSYREYVGMGSAAWRKKINFETQFIQGEGMVPGKPEEQKSN